MLVPELNAEKIWFLLQILRHGTTSCTHDLQVQEDGYCVSLQDIRSASQRIKDFVNFTPLIRCSALDKISGRKLFLKAENLQRTGSFKYRGAVNALALLKESLKNKKKVKLVTHSCGNHGQALSKACHVFGMTLDVVVPFNASECKKQAVRDYGGNLVECEATPGGRLRKVVDICWKDNALLIHPTTCPDLIAGHGTMAIEMLKQNPDLDAIVAPVGGGGMISGIAIAAKQIKPSIKIYAAEPEVANDCFLSKRRGYRIQLRNVPQTLAEGVKVNIYKNTWPIIRDFVDDVILVSEDEILKATKLVWERCKLVIEPTSGLGVAAVIGNNFSSAKNCDENVKNVGIVLCGGNIDTRAIAATV